MVRHYADVPDHSNLSVPCTQNPDRRMADAAVQAVADAVDYDRLCERAYALKQPAVEGHSAGGRDERTAKDLHEQLTETLHGLAEAYAAAGSTIIAVRDAMKGEPSAPQAVEMDRVLRDATAGASMLKAVGGNTAK